MLLSFVRGYGPSSSLIALKTGLFSHVDVVLPDGRLLGARSDKADGVRGVAIRKADYEKWQHRMVLDVPVTDAQWAIGWAWLQLQLGKNYDWLAIVAFAIDRNWRDEDSWFCSELVTRLGEIMALFGDPARNGELYMFENKIDPGGCGLVYQALPHSRILTSY